MFKRILKIGGVIIVVLLVVVTLAFSFVKYNNAICRAVKVTYPDKEIIEIDKNEIVKLVKAADENILGKKLNDIDATVIEKAVEKHKAVLSAEAFKVVALDSSSFKGVVTIKVKHRKPVLRIISGDENYYLDNIGGKIPVSQSYSANVLTATGIISEKYAQEKLLPFILFIENDDFWNAQVEQVHIEKSGNVLLVPLVGEHRIELGDITNFTEKLRNMKAFYSQVLAKNNWNKYKSISVKYKNQVIAKRR